MRIGIDARFLTHPQVGGFKTYTVSLVRALTQIDTRNDYVLYVDRALDGGADLPSGPNCTIVVVAGTLPLVGMPWREQVALPRRTRHDRLDLLHSPALTAPLSAACPLVVTVHDTIWLDAGTPPAASVRRRLMAAYFRSVARRAARRAAIVLTVSQSSKQDVVEHLGLDERRVVVTYEAADPQFRPVSAAQVAAARQRLRLPPAFVMALGSADPRKNVDGLVRAYSRVPPALRADYPLVLVWAHPHLATEVAGRIDALGLAGEVRFLHSVSNEDLVSVYNAASLFVFPSFAEGFGLPLLEAMACGTPVVASNNSSIPEVAGDSALLFDAADTREMADVITRVLTDDSLRGRMTIQGSSRAAAFSWEKCARETLDAYERAACVQTPRRESAFDQEGRS